MTIRKKTHTSKPVPKVNSTNTQEQSLALCFIYKLLQQAQEHRLPLDELIDESVILRNLVASGMPRRYLNGLRNVDLPKLLSKVGTNNKSHQLKWLNDVVHSVSLATFAGLNFYQNIRTLAKSTSHPRLYSRLYLFCYLKQVCDPFKQIVDELIPDFSNTEDGVFVLLNILGITEHEINQAFVDCDHSQTSNQSLLVNQNESVHLQEYASIDVKEFLTNIELPNKFTSVIKKQPSINSVEQLIRECYQLNDETKLSPSDFAPELFMPLYQYLDTAITNNNHGVNILLHGEPGVGKTELVKTLASSLECDLFDVTKNSSDEYNSNLSLSVESELLKTQLLCKQLENIILLVDECEDFFYESSSNGRNIRKHQINQTLECLAKPTIWITNNPQSLDDAYLRRFDMVVEVTSPAPQNYEKTVRELSKGLRLSSQYITHICSHENLTIAHIEKAIKVTRTFGLSATEAQEQITMLLNGYLIAGGYKKLEELKNITQLDYDLSLTHCVGHDLNTVKKGVNRIGEARVLLYGPPGTGKSAYAKYLSSELGLPLIVKKASDLLGVYVGETEKQIAAAFDEAKDKGAILLLDEVDSFLNSREGHSQSWESTMVNEMLTQMESFDGVFIATTNFNKKLDHAVARRFDFKIKLDYLMPEQSIKMFKQLTKRITAQTLDKLSTLKNLTPGDFAVVTRKAALLGKHSESDIFELLIQESAYKQPGSKSIGFI